MSFNCTNLHPSTETLFEALGGYKHFVSIVQTYILQLKQAHPGPDSAPLVGFNCTNLHPSTETWIA